MDPVRPLPRGHLDDSIYQTEVLRLPLGESEASQQQRLTEDALRLGLRQPEIEVTASLAASIAAGTIDLDASPILSSGSSTDRNSIRDSSRSPTALPVETLASSISECTLCSDRANSNRSIASFSTRPTSFSSTEGKPQPQPHAKEEVQPENKPKAETGNDKSTRRKSIKSAIGKIHLRKKKPAPSPPSSQPSQVALAQKDGVSKVYVEPKTEDTQPDEKEKTVKLEIPVYDNDALQRSADNAELRHMQESHKLERNRHLAFQETECSKLRDQQQTSIAETLAENQRVEDEKREKNASMTARLEERQLAVEMEQQREFERAKRNSRTRIKYMEGYISNSESPAPTPRSQSVSSSEGNHPTRKPTSQHKAQLAQEYHDHDSMDQLHEAKIKVLRERQEARLMEAVEKMETELENLVDKHADSLSELQEEHAREEAALLQAFDAKKVKLRHRWTLEEAILRKKLETKHGRAFGPLPPLVFGELQHSQSNSHLDSETRDSAISVTDQDASDGDEEPSRSRGRPTL